MCRKQKMPNTPFNNPPVQTPVSSADSPLEMLAREHTAHLDLCDKLEDIADSLPNNIDPQACTCAAVALRHRVGVHHVVEEEALFPLLSARAGDDAVFLRTLERLQDEHRTDEGYCDEVIELLTALSKGDTPENVEAAGYLLRGLFECMRRHIAFEEDHLLPKAREVLDASDLRILASHMAKTGAGRKSTCFDLNKK
jgi:hemerythrin-like domain-containing protein